MSKDISIPISENLIEELSVFLKEKCASYGISAACEEAIRYWLDSMEWKYDDIYRVSRNGVRWKELFLPHGTRLRMRYKKQWHYADVVDDQIFYDDETVKSPNQFASAITGGVANAWKNVELLLPGSQSWEFAYEVRARATQDAKGMEKGDTKLLELRKKSKTVGNKFTEEGLNEVYQMMKEGKSNSEIAKIFAVSSSAISKHRSKFKL